MKSSQTIETFTEIPKYDFFEGKPIEQVPVLLNSAPERRIASFYDVSKERVNENSPDAELFRDNYFTTGDMFVIDPSDSGEMKVVHSTNPDASDILSRFKSFDQLVDYSFPITRDEYQSLEGDDVLVVGSNDVKALRNYGYSVPKTREDIHYMLNRGDEKVNDANTKLQEKLGRTIDNSKGVYVPNVVGVRLVWVGSGGGSSANGNGILNYANGRLVGVAAEPQVKANGVVTPQKIFESVMPYLSSRTIHQGFTKKGLMEAIKNSYE